MLVDSYDCVLCGKNHRTKNPLEPHDPTMAKLELTVGKSWGLPVIHDHIDWYAQRHQVTLCAACVVPLLDYLKEKGILK